MAISPSILSSSVAAELAALGDAIHSGDPFPEARAAALVSLIAEFPAERSARTESEIIHAARLYKRWYPAPVRPAMPMDWLFGWLFPRRVPPPHWDAALLRSAPSLSMIFMFHCDGHIREKALDMISGEVRSPYYFSAIARRLNDWVPQVRQAAERCAQRVFSMTDPAVVAAAAGYLLTTKGDWGRWNNRLEALLDDAIAREDVAAALAASLISQSRGPAAVLLRHALRRPMLDPYLPHLTANARLPIVRGIGLRTLLEGAATWSTSRRWNSVFDRWERPVERRPIEVSVDREELIRRGLGDASVLVRKIAVDGLIRYRSDLPNVADLASELDGEKNGGVMDRLDFLRRKLAEEQVAP